jgi:hypothetical protein
MVHIRGNTLDRKCMFFYMTELIYPEVQKHFLRITSDLLNRFRDLFFTVFDENDKIYQTEKALRLLDHVTETFWFEPSPNQIESAGRKSDDSCGTL